LRAAVTRLAHMDDAERALRTQAKQQIRQRMRSVRRVLPQEACERRSAALCERVLQLPELARAGVVVGYFASRKEADPGALLSALHSEGKRIGLPRVLNDGGLSLLRYAPGDALEPNAFDILEPPAAAEPIAPGAVDLILVPALAVDERGQRIGYGAGYYDRLLPRMPRAFKVAIVYDFQLLAELPDTEGDVPVACVVTDARTLRVGDG